MNPDAFIKPDLRLQDAPVAAGRWAYLLSLDAVAIVLAWAWAFSEVFLRPLASTVYVVLGTGIWLGYLADRWLDAIRTTAGHGPLEPHHVGLRGRRIGFALLWAGVLAFSIGLAHLVFPSEILRRGWVLAGLALAYTLLAQWSPAWFWRVRPWAVGALLAAAIGIFHSGLSGKQVLALGMLALVFATNCQAIRWRERSSPRTAGRAALLLAHGVALAAGGLALPWPWVGLLLIGWILQLTALEIHPLSTPDKRSPFRTTADGLLLLPPLLLLIIGAF